MKRKKIVVISDDWYYLCGFYHAELNLKITYLLNEVNVIDEVSGMDNTIFIISISSLTVMRDLVMKLTNIKGCIIIPVYDISVDMFSRRICCLSKRDEFNRVFVFIKRLVLCGDNYIKPSVTKRQSNIIIKLASGRGQSSIARMEMRSAKTISGVKRIIMDKFGIIEANSLAIIMADIIVRASIFQR